MAQPTLLPSAWAVNGDKNTIPSSSAQQGVVNWNNGWDSVYSTPISTGGQAPVRADFNGVLNSISAHTIFAQNGGMYAWNATTTYDVNAIVQGSDNTAYIAVQGSNTNHNPVNDTAMTYWRPLKGVPFTGASVSTAGNTGLVPAPSAGDQSKVLKGDGTWGALSFISLPDWSAPTALSLTLSNNIYTSSVMPSDGWLHTTYRPQDDSWNGFKVYVYLYNTSNVLIDTFWNYGRYGHSIEVFIPVKQGFYITLSSPHGYNDQTAIFYPFLS